jgi:anaerobic glycerol-3-phosphate dehydrogenase C subunit
MDPDRARILADLGGLLDGQIRCDDPFLQLYSCDASLYEIKPLGVVRPLGLDDVVACVNYARENHLSIIPRGSGSNVVGGSVGSGIVLDFSYGMRQVISVDRESVRAQPGAVLSELNLQLKPHGRMFSPDPATRSVTTIGGAIAMNRTGSHWIQAGSPREKIMRLQVVAASGEVVEFDSVANQNLLPQLSDSSSGKAEVHRLSTRIGSIIDRNQELIASSKPNTKLNQAGYNLFDLRHDDKIDLTRLITGSEGTLGIITEATVRTEPIPRHRGVALLFFHAMEKAALAAVEINKMGVVACDLLDRRLLSLARETNTKFFRLVPVDAEAMLLVEFEAADDGILREKLEHLTHRIQRRKKLAYEVRTTTQAEERDLFWHLVRRVVPTLYRLRGNRRAIPFIEDIGVDPLELPAFLKSLHGVLNEHDITASIFSHTPQGMVHVRPFLNLSDAKDVAKMVPLAKSVFEQVLAAGGSISGSQGDGLSRTWYLRSQYGKLHSVFSEVKNVFDPENIFNPGKIVGQPYSGLTDNLRKLHVGAVIRELTEGNSVVADELVTTPVGSDSVDSADLANRDGESNSNKSWFKSRIKPAKNSLPIIVPELNWSIGELATAARNCNGCGRCRTGMSHERMCPVFRLAPVEESSPRAKANLMRGVVTGQLDVNSLATDEVKAIADLCVNCHQCRIECPASVDIPKLMVEAKAQYYATNGLKISDWILTRLDWLYSMAGRMPRVANRMIQSPFARWVIDRTLGISQGRKLPLFATRTFFKWAQKSQLTRPSKQQSRKVVYFVDAFVNWNDVELGQAFVEVLKHNNIDVLIPPNQSVSGMSMISDGSILRAKRLALRNVELLSEWVRQGYQIVTTEPSAALALKHEYLNLLDEADAKRVAEVTIDCSSFLLSLHEAGELALDFNPVNANVGYHLPCHQRAVMEGQPGPSIPAVELLRLIPGLQVEVIDKGCSGMAGTFGLKRKNYWRSLRMGVQLIQAMREPSILVGATECSTCKIQMEQGTSKPTVHPVKFLAMAYGLMPNDLGDLLTRRSGERTLS